MVDLQTVCCMCGDVGFQDKLFRCSGCRNRFQHSYCSNFFSEFAGPIEVCDWCQSGPDLRYGPGANMSKRIHHHGMQTLHLQEIIDLVMSMKCGHPTPATKSSNKCTTTEAAPQRIRPPEKSRRLGPPPVGISFSRMLCAD